MQQELIQEFAEQSILRIDENTEKIEKCFTQLSQDEIWKSPNDSSNSIGNLVLHLCGNIRQYAISSLGKTTDIRQRDEEFSKGQSLPKEDLLQRLKDTTEEAKSIISKADIDNLLRKRNVQGYYFSGMGVVIHVTEHYSYHTGQIALLTKLWKNKDLGFYAGIDLNAMNNEQ
ncbi:MAG: DinB family protein [Bacteroidota bacterium]